MHSNNIISPANNHFNTISIKWLWIIVGCFFIAGCKTKGIDQNGLHFTLLSGSKTGIDFNNKITENDSINIYDNEYMYNGSGVGIGDFNNDGLPDIFFGGSMVSSRLYINKGDFKFEDITEKAGLQTTQWCTGVNVVDINGDGYDDIYICSSHSHNKNKRKNLLLINDGKLHFTEQAAAYGLADTGFSTQAAFFDYDKDGDLDMYLINHNLYSHTANDLLPKDTSGNNAAQDRLYKNDGILPGQSHPHFHDVSREAGIKEDGYGLGVVVTDVNDDNWPDVYVANDYIANDLLWLNNKNGTFTNIIASALKHQSYNSMGIDAADINNDCLPDIAVMDMLPENNERKKMMFNATGQEKFEMQQRFGYEPEFVRNMLQLNNGVRQKDGKAEPFYSEIGQLAGIFQTDWSWSVLMADFDNDGFKDMHITNGEAKDVTNNDFTAFNAAHGADNYTFGGSHKSIKPGKETIMQLRKSLDEYGSIKVNNYLFRNMGDLTFSDITDSSGLNNPSVSQGAAYADLDNDGDLDLVVNNMNEEAFVYRNEIRTSAKDSTANYITIQLKGTRQNLLGLGAKVILFNGGSTQFLEQSPVRGFSSVVDERLHFGIGKVFKIDSLKIQWPDDKIQILRNVKANQVLTLDHANAASVTPPGQNAVSPVLFTNVAAQSGINFIHKESSFFDYAYQRALPQKFSQLGPCIATGDINGDGLDDFFAGGAAYQSGKLFFQNSSGGFTAKNLVEDTKQEEDLAVQLFDADGDKDLDLLISGGSSEFGPNSSMNALRLYNNDGKGHFTLNKQAFPQAINVVSKAVTVADYDGDGDLDVFVGAYISPQKYPAIPQSYILQNNNSIFTNVTNLICPALQQPGMITGALWTDFNGDHQPDLVVCGEWMPVRFFVNDHAKLKEVTNEIGLANNNGMWRTLEAADIDGDGDIDYVAGNMGLNNKYRATAAEPAMLYAKDIDKNGADELVPAYYSRNKKGNYDLYPSIDRNLLAEELPSIKKKYLLYEDYAKTTMQQLLKDYDDTGWTTLKCETMQSVWIENKGGEKFTLHPLPLQAQFAPVNAIIVTDANGDGNADLLLAGNEYQTEVMTGRYDASYGLVLEGDGKGAFTPVNVIKSGFIIDGDVKSMKPVALANHQRLIVAAVNNDSLRCFRQAADVSQRLSKR